jgi:hypothetical protein
MISVSKVQVHQLSSLSWKNFTLQSNYHTYDIQHQQIQFANGVIFNVPRIFLNAKDVAINNESIIILAKEHKVKNIFSESKKETDIKNIISNTSLAVYNYTPEQYANSVVVRGGVTTIEKRVFETEKYSPYFLSTKNNIISLSNKKTIQNTEVFNLSFRRDYVRVFNADGYYLTDRGTFLQLLPQSTTFEQRFNYILNNDNIILFKYNTLFTKVIDFSFKFGSVNFVDITSVSNIPQGSVLYINQLKDFNINSSLENSYIAKYNTSPLSASNTLEIDEKTKQLNYYQEYLINIPIKNSIQDNAKHTAYISSLKNYQTSNYNYLINDNKLENRVYTNIFTGTNQQNGYNNIYLNFVSDTLEKVLHKDTETTFHYPATIANTGMPLSASNLIDEGAISGKNPYTSDRIMLARKDYRELGVPLLSADIADNTWLYAWLSAGDNGESVWMDRFYRGAKYDITENEYLLYTVNDPLIVDIPSEMYLLPNRIYKYFHQGQKNITTYIEQLSSIDSDNGTKLLDVRDWSKNDLIDLSKYKNNGLISLNSTDLVSDYFYLDGKSYALFPSTSSLSEDRQLYVGFWLKVNNWNEIEGSQIVGNYAEGGYGLFNKQAIPTTFITMVDNNNNYLYNFNSNFKVINEQSILPSTPKAFTKPVYIIRTADQNYWLINANTLTAGKYDLNNNLLFEIKNLSPIKNITQVEIDDIERIYIVDNVTQKFLTFESSTGVIVTPGGAPFAYKRLEIAVNYDGPLTSNIIRPGTFSTRVNDKLSQATLIGIDGNFSVTDNNNNIWYNVGVNLYKNTSIYATIGNIQYITCDRNNNIWILHDTYKLTKINTISNLIEFTKTFKSTQIDNITNQQSRFINFISLKENNKETDYAIIVDNQEKTCYLIKLDGSLFNKINLLIIPSVFLTKRNFLRDGINFTCYGDFTGYQFQRKFNNNYELVWKVKITQASGYTISNMSADKTIYLPFNTSQIDQGWHYFSFCFDHQRGKISAYVDGIILNQYSFEPFKYKIKTSYKPLTIGAITTDQGLLNDTVGMNDKHKLIAYISRFHIYKYAFDKHTIDLLYKSTFVDMYKDLTWNINIGKRNYIEQIDKFFMHKMPGNKSKLFNLKIKNFPATEKQKLLIKQALESTIEKIIPADTVLHTIKWE